MTNYASQFDFQQRLDQARKYIYYRLRTEKNYVIDPAKAWQAAHTVVCWRNFTQWNPENQNGGNRPLREIEGSVDGNR